MKGLFEIVVLVTMLVFINNGVKKHVELDSAGNYFYPMQ